MAKVNLLPWRAERRRVRQQEFYYMLGGAFVVALVLGFAGVFYFSAQIDGQTSRNAYLSSEITKLDDQIKQIQDLDKEKDKLLRRKEVIEQLQSNRSQMVHLFDELVKTIPDGVRLSAVKQDGNKLTLEGFSQSNARVSAYMRNIEASGWMTNPDLSVIQVQGDDKTLPYQFNLSLTLIRPGQVVDASGNPVIGADSNQAPGGSASPASSGPAPAASAASTKGGAKP